MSINSKIQAAALNPIIVILAFFVLQLASMQVASSAENNVMVAMHAFKVVATAMGTKLVATDAVMPGDIIEYQVTYSNTGAAPARDVMATLPVPKAGLAYVTDSAMPVAVQAASME